MTEELFVLMVICLVTAYLLMFLTDMSLFFVYLLLSFFFLFPASKTENRDEVQPEDTVTEPKLEAEQFHV